MSPNLDELAKKATVFERAYSMASYTGKSVGPMMIGKYPSETFRDGGHFNTYFPKNMMVAERVRDGAGVRTFAAHCHWYFRFPTGLNQGFDAWDTSAIPPGMGDNDTSITSERMSDLALKLLAKPENTSLGAARTGVRARQRARRRDATTADCRSPLRSLPSTAAPAATAASSPGFTSSTRTRSTLPHQGAPDFSGPFPAKNLYDQEVWFTDKHIGKVLDYIKSQPWAEDTAIVLTADHGEAFADHGMNWHGQEIWESLIRVPLVVYIPGAKPRRVSVKRSHIDVAPTLLEIMGGPPDEDGELRGTSLLADVYLPEGAEHEERDVFVDMPAGPYNGIRRAVITGPTPGMKLINQGGATYQLFDLANDPKEASRSLAATRRSSRPCSSACRRLARGSRKSTSSRTRRERRRAERRSTSPSSTSDSQIEIRRARDEALALGDARHADGEAARRPAGADVLRAVTDHPRVARGDPEPRDHVEHAGRRRLERTVAATPDRPEKRADSERVEHERA